MCTTWQVIASCAILKSPTTAKLLKAMNRVRPMYTSDIENQRHRSLLEHRRRQVADVDVVKIEFAGGGVCDSLLLL